MNVTDAKKASNLPAPTFADVEAAAHRLAGIAHRTPVITSRTVNERSGAQLFFKCENFQRAGAFKFRGAYNAISALSPAERSRGVVTYSSGNHAQAIALAGQLLEAPRTIVMPQDAPALKVEATRGYGGDILFYDRYTENREEIGARISAERGMTLIPPYDHPMVIAGQGTATKELLEKVGELDLLFVPLGGGGLLAGALLSARALSPRCRVIGVEPAAAADGKLSLEAGHVVRIPAPKSLADGAIVTHLGDYNFAIIKDLVDDLVTVTDDALVETMRLFAERMKIIVEPTGCLGVAAALSRDFHQPGQRIGVLLSGGNVDLPRYAELIA
jgi:threonine dehydratase